MCWCFATTSDQRRMMQDAHNSSQAEVEPRICAQHLAMVNVGAIYFAGQAI